MLTIRLTTMLGASKFKIGPSEEAHCMYKPTIDMDVDAKSWIWGLITRADLNESSDECGVRIFCFEH